MFGQMSAEEFGLGLATYIGAHFSLVGWSMDTGVPIPPSQPQDLPEMTFMQYMDALGIGYLKNTFTCEQSRTIHSPLPGIVSASPQCIILYPVQPILRTHSAYSVHRYKHKKQ